ncbi:uncharacterized protein B0I36DRAFT_360675 [Microdochium trichocladiopsis]|uniref:Uncharacterized protein n=1 Tax=Microdochium trichocladiopsis TaxID=1682393 RepID=A0A9P9BTA4_9PEZI|nr:uncharacterized protein B0I36DRAFT_360675 [Microdochium trichocladiopsis]KAH7035282.1 hypothetical protein B0I36DRAFT_360675 [Microdochium trichocladiopsis]
MAAITDPYHLHDEQAPCPGCEADMAPASSSDFYAGLYCRNRPPVLNERFSRVATDLEASLLQAHLTDDDEITAISQPAQSPLITSAQIPALAEAYEPSIDSLATLKGVIDHPDQPDQARPYLVYVLDNRCLDPGYDVETYQALDLTEHAMAAHEISHAQSYPTNIESWAPLPPALLANTRGSPTPAALGLSESLVLGAKSTTSSRSVMTGSSWCPVTYPGDEEEGPYATDLFVCATGGQFDDDSASPFSIDEMLISNLV